MTRTCLAQQDASSHIPPEDLKARFQGAGGGYIRRRRKSRRKIYTTGEDENSPFAPRVQNRVRILRAERRGLLVSGKRENIHLW